MRFDLTDGQDKQHQGEAERLNTAGIVIGHGRDSSDKQHPGKQNDKIQQGL